MGTGADASAIVKDMSVTLLYAVMALLQAPTLNAEETKIGQNLKPLGGNLQFVSTEDGWELSLDVNSCPKPFDFAAVKGLKRLAALRVMGGSIKEDSLKELVGCPKLNLLVLVVSGLTDKGMPHIGKLKGLTKLDVKGPLTAQGLKHLKPLDALERLYLYNATLTDAQVTPLEDLKQLKLLYVPASVTEAAVERLRKALPKTNVVRDR